MFIHQLWSQSIWVELFKYSHFHRANHIYICTHTTLRIQSKFNFNCNCNWSFDFDNISFIYGRFVFFLSLCECVHRLVLVCNVYHHVLLFREYFGCKVNEKEKKKTWKHKLVHIIYSVIISFHKCIRFVE